jgi:hypothetical protein
MSLAAARAADYADVAAPLEADMTRDPFDLPCF